MKYGDPVAVIIVSYNSESTILETLNSIERQDYPSIELIIYDDSSTDNTTEITQNWLRVHDKRFVRTLFFVQKKNVGISANANCAYKQAKSEWIKGIAADDILFNNAISLNVNYLIENHINTVIFSYVLLFSEKDGEKYYHKRDWEEIHYCQKVSEMSPDKQYRALIRREILCSPTLFINTALFLEVGGFDEQFKNLEDWPLKIKIAQKNHKIYFMKRDTVYYRQGNSISHIQSEILSKSHIEEIYMVKRRLCYPNISLWNLIFYYEEINIRIKNYILINVLGNKRNRITEFVNLFFNLLLPKKWKKIFFRLFKISC